MATRRRSLLLPHDSNVASLLAWDARPRSLFVFLSGVALYASYNVFGYSLASVALNVAAITLLLSAALRGAAAVAANRGWGRVPTLALPVGADAVREVVQALGGRLAAGAAQANELLAWSDVGASTRALAYSWLACRFSFLFAPSVLFSVWVAAFLIAPAYSFAGSALDAVWASQVQPALARVFGVVEAATARVGGLSQRYRSMLPIVGGTLSVALLYLLWGAVSLTQLLTCIAFVIVALHVLELVSAPAAAEPRPHTE